MSKGEDSVDKHHLIHNLSELESSKMNNQFNQIQKSKSIRHNQTMNSRDRVSVEQNFDHFSMKDDN